MALLAFSCLAYAVALLGRHAWLEASLLASLGMTSLGAATELLRPSVGE